MKLISLLIALVLFTSFTGAVTTSIPTVLIALNNSTSHSQQVCSSTIPIVRLNNLNTTTASNGNISGSGTTNYLPKFKSDGTIGNSRIYDNGAYIGFGTNNPLAGIDMKVDNNLHLVFYSTNATTVDFYVSDDIGNPRTFMLDGSQVIFNSFGGSSVFKGNVGIGIDTPTQKLDVKGSVNISGTYYAQNKTGFTGSGTSCTITAITGGIITGATCV
jgi:hypothetical protein